MTTGGAGITVRQEKLLRWHWPGAAAALLALAAYVRTTCPTVYAYDSAELATVAHTLGLAHSPGYPLYALLGKLFTFLPVGSIAYRVNLMSAVFGGLSIGALYACLYLLTKSRLAAVAGALAFGFSAVYWEQAVVAEVYTLQFLLLGLGMAFLLGWWRTGRRRWLIAAAAMLGLTLTNHTGAVLLLPGVAALLWQGGRDRPIGRRGWAWVAVAGAAPLLLYAYLPLRAGMHPTYDWPREIGLDIRTLGGLLAHVSGSAFDFSLSASTHDLASGISLFTSTLLSSFAWIGVPLGLAGLVRLYRRERPLLWFSAALFALPTAVFVNYHVYDQEVFFFP
jgi:hypothetical protein